MSPKLSLKILYRSPVRTVLTFILLAAVTFALFSQVLEYSVAKREMEKMVDLYDGVGIVETGTFTSALGSVPAYIYADERVPQGHIPDKAYIAYLGLGYEHFPAEVMDDMLKMPYITYTDTRYMTAGVTEYRRFDQSTEYYDYTNICVVEGTVQSYNKETGKILVEEPVLIGGEPMLKDRFGENSIYISAEPAYVLEEMSMPVYYHTINNRAVVLATENSVYTQEYLQTLTPGERYVFVLRYEDKLTHEITASGASDNYTYYLTDPFVYGQCDAVYPLAGEPENYLETEKFAPLREYIEIVETDQYTIDVVYTRNMESIRYFMEGKLGIGKGRAIAPEDTEEKNNVCVISYHFAFQNDLDVGDKITVALGNKLFSQNRAVGAIAAVKERASTEYTTVELEIVGICTDTRNKYASVEYNEAAWSYGANAVFVPQHLLNVDEAELERHTFHPGEISFVVENAWDIPAFIEKVIPQIEELGYSIRFDDDGFMDIVSPLVETERIAAIKIAVLLFAVVVVTWFVSMLYVVGRRRDYAVMRILGTTKARAARTLLLPLGVIALASVLAGSAAAYTNTLQNIADSQYLGAINGIEIDMSISPGVMTACIVGELVLALLMALLLISIIGRKPPLELMQSGSHKREKRRNTQIADEAVLTVELSQWVSVERPVTDGRSRSVRFSVKYVLRHIRRTLGKALMFVFVMALLLNVLGQLVIMRDAYVNVFESTEVTSYFTGYLNLRYVDELHKSGYVKNVYYCQDKLVTVDRATYTSTNVTFCCDLNLYAESKGVENLQVTWLDGYDETSLHYLGNVIVLGEDYAMRYGYEIGDTIEIADEGAYYAVVKNVLEVYRREHPENAGYSDEEIMELEHDKIMERYSKKMDEFLVIGIINGVFGEILFTPGSDTRSSGYGALIIPPSVTAVLADNYKAEEYRAYAEEIAGINKYSEVVFIMDTSKIENVRNNIELMNTLYPIMVAAVMIIGAFLCGMLIIQNSKDIAIMRVLGTSKRRVRAIMVLEHMLLCAVGVILAAAVLTVRGVVTDMLWVLGLYVVVVFIASLAASASASRKKVLELLQTKE